MKAIKKSEWFELEKPIGEPDIAKNWRGDSYCIERITKDNGDVIWFGQGVNWQKINNGEWCILGEDENVKPTETYYDSEGNIDGYDYPEGRTIWIECEMPIYEKLYLELPK